MQCCSHLAVPQIWVKQPSLFAVQVQKGRDDVMLEFPADDTAGGDQEDALFEMSFHVPKENDTFGGEETTSAAEVSTMLCNPCDVA